MSKNYTTAC